jgi:hypothetical protein
MVDTLDNNVLRKTMAEFFITKREQKEKEKENPKPNSTHESKLNPGQNKSVKVILKIIRRYFKIS